MGPGEGTVVAEVQHMLGKACLLWDGLGRDPVQPDQLIVLQTLAGSKLQRLQDLTCPMHVNRDSMEATLQGRPLPVCGGCGTERHFSAVTRRW